MVCYIEKLLDPTFIIGFVVTLFLGILGIIYTIRVKLSEITFVPDQFIFLVDNLLSEYEDIKISYNEHLIDKNISLIKGTFINTGKDDIDFKNAEKNIKILFSEGAKIVKARIVNKSEELKVKLNTENNIIEVKAGIFKRDEFFIFEAIISFPSDVNFKKIDSKNIYSIIDFEHRVKNLKRIKKSQITIDNVSAFDKNITRFFTFVLIPLLIFGNTFLNPRKLAPMTLKSMEISYLLFDESSSDSFLVSIFPIASDSISISGLNDNYNKVVSIDDFYYKLRWKPLITPVTEDKSINLRLKLTMYLSFIFSIIYLTFISLDLIEKYKRKKIKRIINR